MNGGRDRTRTGIVPVTLISFRKRGGYAPILEVRVRFELTSFRYGELA